MLLNQGGTGYYEKRYKSVSVGGCVRKWGALCDWPTATLRERALEMAQGEFVTFVDSDSVLLPDALEK
ncbi:glycosyltransferase family A protein [Moorena sp. SIO3H5]|uniref:glycosyltransferase family A protein n=1 Tax=Moorena sp. SIO3H5 TaxID=2607834 RepID=UPI0013BC5543|nr:glycosyltransferase family A protein [Moorena sp. SIO3H5]NEO70868.1 glycosyltransferase family 2 protein [Moorena sp. SIO3H5]